MRHYEAIKKSLGKYNIVLCLVPHGYEIDLIDPKDYCENKVTTIYSECRDYGKNIDVEKLSQKIIELVKSAEDDFLK